MRWVECTQGDFSGEPPSPRSGHSAVVVNGSMLVVFGGLRDSKFLGDVVVLDIANKTWFHPECRGGGPEGEVGPGPRAFHVAVSIDCHMFIFGGRSGRKRQGDFWMLDTDTWQWVELTGYGDLPPPRDFAAGVSAGNGNLVICGGSDGNKWTSDVYVLNTISLEWTLVRGASPMPPPRCAHAAVMVENRHSTQSIETRLLMFGGRAGGGGPILGDLWVFKGVAGEESPAWTKLTLPGPVPAPRCGHSMTPSGTQVWVFGGQSTGGWLTRYDIYYNDSVVLDRGDQAGALVEPDTSSAGGGDRLDTGPTVGVVGGVGFDSTYFADIAAPASRGPELQSEITEYLRGLVLAAARPPRPPSGGQQSSMNNFVLDELLKEFDQAVASFFFENAMAFNAARYDSYKNMERIMNLAARSRKMLRLPGYKHLRMKALPMEYKAMDQDLDVIREPWDVIGLTLMTDGTTTTSNRPIINFLAGGDSGAVMVRSMDMERKDKSAPTLTRMWEEVIRELGVHRVNAIYTDSAQVNMFARKILAEREDPAIRSIPWHPTLTKIAVKVISMWTTASPCERNWSTFDLIHMKRRNLLSPDNLQMLVFIHWNKKLLRMSRVKMEFVNTERFEWETPEDETPFDGFMRDGEYDPAEVKRRAANWYKSRSRRSKGTRFDVLELLEDMVDDRAWLLDLSYHPRRVADDACWKSVVADDDDEEESDDSEGDDELLDVRLIDIQSTRHSGGGACSARHDDITPPTVLATGGHSAAPLLSLSDDVGVLEVDADFGGTAEHADGDIGADMDDPPPGTAEVTEAVGGDVISTPDQGLGMGEGFASLLHHVAPHCAERLQQGLPSLISQRCARHFERFTENRNLVLSFDNSRGYHVMLMWKAPGASLIVSLVFGAASGVQWKRPNISNEPPPARAYHTMTAIGNRFLLFGGYNGKTTFGDAWFLVPEDDPLAKRIQPKSPSEKTKSASSTDSRGSNVTDKRPGTPRSSVESKDDVNRVKGLSELRVRLGLPPVELATGRFWDSPLDGSGNAALVNLGLKLMEGEDRAKEAETRETTALPMEAASVARKYLSECEPTSLRLCQLQALLDDYRILVAAKHEQWRVREQCQQHRFARRKKKKDGKDDEDDNKERSEVKELSAERSIMPPSSVVSTAVVKVSAPSSNSLCSLFYRLRRLGSRKGDNCSDNSSNRKKRSIAKWLCCRISVIADLAMHPCGGDRRRTLSRGQTTPASVGETPDSVASSNHQWPSQTPSPLFSSSLDKTPVARHHFYHLRNASQVRLDDIPKLLEEYRQLLRELHQSATPSTAS
ncbi:hypothetical protein CBR_g30411 [Chara braunii]|uniref:Uncharacterized protein n=1 Tax=Chara braunii TaxID=69332 RepID=A0A388LCM7_CHABU|nr:hypothetical protein CBR_g30411 [Chara braunii]|eukprot:GBG80044.1 hypothetical protein CBR_g30411 [Chara braunii]